MSQPASPLPIDPKELVPAAVGVVLGVGILVLFIALGLVLDMTFLVDIGDIPRQ